MRIEDVVLLKEVANDLNDGKVFYDYREAGVGDYFYDSLVADIESLIIYEGKWKYSGEEAYETTKAENLRGSFFRNRHQATQNHQVFHF